MIKELNTLLKTAFADSDIFNNVFGLAESVMDDNGEFPAIYNGGGNYSMINLDSEQSFIYWRVINDIPVDKANERESLTSCSSKDELIFKVPLIFVCFAKKQSISDCIGFEEYQFAEEIVKILNTVKPRTISNVQEGSVLIKKIIINLCITII